MSKFFYKGISVTNQITKTAGANTVSNPPGYNFSAAFTNHPGELPLTFGCFSKSGNITTDISNLCKAAGQIYNSSPPIFATPTGCKSIRVSGIGGGGGTGGVGGSAKAKCAFPGKSSATGYGGAGGSGGYGQYGSFTYTLLNIPENIYVQLGTPGNTGNVGNNNATNGGTTNGGAGNVGNAGNATLIKIGNAASIPVGNAGNGGLGGNGGSAKADTNNADSTKGNTGAAGNISQNDQSSTNFPSLAPAGDPGTLGALQIVFLYN
jgi:hypothetical protein